MKKNRILIVTAILAIAVILSGCATGPRVTDSPGVALSGDMVFVAYNFSFYGLSIPDERIEWSFPQDSNNRTYFLAQPLVADDYVYIGDSDNNFYKINIETGNAEWTFDQAKGFFVGLAAEEDGIVYAPSNDGKVYAIDADGKLLWPFETGHFIWAQPQIANDVVYIGSMDHFVYAVNKSDGQEIWKYEMGGAIVNSILLSEDESTLYVGSIGNEIIALDASLEDISDEERVLWSFDADGDLGSVWGRAILVDNVLYFADTTGNIYALDSETGEEVWSNPIIFSGSIIGGLTALEDGFVFATEEGNIRGYNFDQSPMPEWNMNEEVEIFQAPVVNDEYLAVGTLGGDDLFYVFDLNGNEVFSGIPEE